jgi:hypothetical protein
MMELLKAVGIGRDEIPARFEATAGYFASMDCLIYLKQDCSYRAVRLSPFITVLLHPQDDKAVGIKVKGVRSLYEALRTFAKEQGLTFPAADFIELVALVEVAFSFGGEAALEKADDERRQRYEEPVKALARKAAPIPALQFELDAAA